MTLNRRQLLMSVAAALPDLSVESARAAFPWASRETYLNSATEHPLSVYSSRAMKNYIDAITNGPDSERDKYENLRFQQETKAMFAQLVRARPSEIAFVPGTQIGENLILEGLGVQTSGGNVVTNDLHYGGSLFNYGRRKEMGLDVRVVKHRDGQIDIRDVERVVDSKTRLIAVALVSNVNGYVEDAVSLSKLAHAHGAYLYADVIQAAGAIPIDVRAMGIDFLACSAYKWLMGGRYGYLYVPEELQGKVLAPTHFGGRGSGQNGAARYEVSTASHIGCVCQHEALAYIHKLGVQNIRPHVRTLTERLQKELPALGYPSVTPRGTDSPIVTFEFKNPEQVRSRLSKAGIIVTLRAGAEGNQMRISPSVFNNRQDVDRLIQALS